MSADDARVILLDTGVLSIATTRRGHPRGEPCRRWMRSCASAGTRIAVPEIADYELRRELLRASNSSAIARLEALEADHRYLPITTGTTRRAAELWAHARQQRTQTAPDQALDSDVILAAQAILLNAPNLVVATTNPGHIARYVAAERWEDIAP